MEDRHLRLIEKRKHPRFLLTHEQFRDVKTGKIFTVYDLSLNSLAIKVDEKHWKEGTMVSGILNLHPESIEISPRLITYYADRAALKMESLSTYAKGVLQKALSPKRLGTSLQLVKEKLPETDLWFHGVCNTDMLLRVEGKEVQKLDLFFANYFFGWNAIQNVVTTGICQSFGPDQREPAFLADEPVRFELIEIEHDEVADESKIDWGMKIIEATVLDAKLKQSLMKNLEKGMKSGS